VALYNTLRQRITRYDHPRLPPKYIGGKHIPVPQIFGSVLEVEVGRLPGKKSGGKLWLWSSTTPATSSEAQNKMLTRAYFHRFDVEHTFRFFKQTLGLTRFNSRRHSTPGSN
jgi:hypothetical protein